MTGIPKRRKTSQAILQSLIGGDVPRIGIDSIAVGREAEMDALAHDLDVIADGGASFRLIVGRHGAGKSFMLQMLRSAAMQKKFVVANADFSQTRRLSGSTGAGLNLYRELLSNMAVRTRPNGNAFAVILEKWISDIQSKVVRSGIEPSSRKFDREVAGEVRRVTGKMEGMVAGYDFGEVLNTYWRGHRDGDEALKRAAMRWLRGEFNTITLAKNALGFKPNSVIDGSSWYNFIKLLAYFVRQIGYRGLVIVLDEAVELSKISHRDARENNYNKILDMYIDTLGGGSAEYLGVLLGATPLMVEDTRRGLFSNDALRSRLEESSFARQGMRDMYAPLIRLDVLSGDEFRLLLQTIRDIHAWHYKYESRLNDGQLREFMAKELSRIGSGTFLTPREVLQDYISLLNMLHQHPRETFESILGEVDFTTGDSADPEMIDSPYASFEI